MREEILSLYELSDGWHSAEDEETPTVCFNTNDHNILHHYDYLELNVIKHQLLSQRQYGLLYFDVIIKGRKIRAMLDSGSSRDIIDMRLQKMLCLEAKCIPEFSLGMADDTPIICKSVVKNAKVKFLSKNARPFKDNMSLSVVDLKGKFEIILGQPFLVRRNPQIDWRERTMTFFNNHNVKASDHQMKITSMRECMGKSTLDVQRNGPTKLQDSTLKNPSEKGIILHNRIVNDDDDDDDDSDEWLSSVKNDKEKLIQNASDIDMHDAANYERDSSIEQDSSTEQEFTDIISASDMKSHLNALRDKFPNAQCALAIVNVPSQDQIASLETQQGSTATTTLNLPIEFNIGDWVCSVKDDLGSDQDRRKQKQLELLRKKVEHRFNQAKMADGSSVMTDKLPAGIPGVRFENDGEMKIETDPAENPAVSGQIPLSVDQLKELQKQMECYIPRGF